MTRQLLIARPHDDPPSEAGFHELTGDCGHEVWVSPQAHAVTEFLGVEPERTVIVCRPCVEEMDPDELMALLEGGKG